MSFLYFVLAFFVLFNFPIPGVYNSAFLALLISLCLYLGPDSKLQNKLNRVFKNKNIIRVLLLFVGVILLTIFTGFIHFTNDYSAIKANVLVLIILTIGIIIYPLIEKIFLNKSNPFTSILKLIIALFLVQAIIECLAFAFPLMADIVHFFQKDLISDKSMGGIRALALSGNPFFDLSAGFGFAFIVMFKFISEKYSNKFSYSNIFIFAILFVGSFFAGRTAYVGLALGLLLYFTSLSNPFAKIYNLLKIIAVLSILSVIIFLILPENIKMVIEESLLPFAFEFIYSYLDTGEFTTDSSEVLNNMYFPISLSTFWLGDGYYTGQDGAYYMHTDAGIMRNILYYGIFGFLFIIFSQLQFFRSPFKIIFNKINVTSFSKSVVNDLLFFVIIFIYIMALHYKGEVLMFMPIIQILLIWLVLSYGEREKVIINEN